MEFQLVSGTILDAEVDFLAIPVFGDPAKDSLVKAADEWLEGALAEVATAEDFQGKANQMVVVPSRELLPARFVALVGLGDKKGWHLSEARHAAANAVKAARRRNATSVAIAAPITGKKAADVVQFLAEGVLMGAYNFDKYRKNAKKNGRSRNEIGRIELSIDRRHESGKALTTSQKRSFRGAIKRGEAIAIAVNKARDLINEPAAYMTPTRMAAEARALAKRHKNLSVKVLGPKECEKLGMNMFLAVGKGSDEEPRFIHLTYKPDKKADKKIALIGKGVTFDSGGYSLKPSASMLDMKIDMSGAAAVVSAMDAIATLGSRHEVHAIAACAENLVSGKAFKLGDVLESMDGTTVEINNTDAEGRLTLGDALTYARTKIEPDEMFDFATLTGACMVALGPYTAALLSGDDKLAAAFLKASENAGEDVWRMPLNRRLREQLKSNIADMRNTGERWGGAITAGLFLQNFVKDTPWVHVDIAGPASVNRAYGAIPRGGTGFGVATIIEYTTR
jgi:leucyl aminopeptidase